MKRRRCARPRSHAAKNSSSPAPGGSGRLSFVPAAASRPVFAPVPGAGIQEPPVLVDVDHDQLRIGFVRVVDAVAVVHVDVDVADAPDAEARTQALDDDAEVVEHAEARGAAPPGVMQAPDRLEAAHRVAGHDPLQALERGAGDHRTAIVDAGECRRVAVVQIALADRRAQLHPAHVLGGVEALELGRRRQTRRRNRDPLVEAAADRLRQERALAVEAQRMAVRKAVLSEQFAHQQQCLARHHPILALPRDSGHTRWQTRWQTSAQNNTASGADSAASATGGRPE